MYVPNTSSSAYQLDMYIETKPDKKAELAKRKQQKIKAMRRKLTLYMTVFFVILFALLFRHVRIYDLHNSINEQTKALQTIQMENEQTKIEIESLTDKTKIQEYAETQLGLKKITSAQVIYINPTNENYMENVAKHNGGEGNGAGSFFADLWNN